MKNTNQGEAPKPTNELEVNTILKYVKNSITDVAMVEGEMLMPVKIGNAVFIKFKNENRYRITLPTKSTDMVTLDTITPQDLVDDFQPKPDNQDAEQTFTSSQINSAKQTRDAIITSISPELKSIYMAGEIVMWDEMQGKLTSAQSTIEALQSQVSFLEGCREDWAVMAIKLKEKLNIETDVANASKMLRKKDAETLCKGFLTSIENRDSTIEQLKGGADKKDKQIQELENRITNQIMKYFKLEKSYTDLKERAEKLVDVCNIILNKTSHVNDAITNDVCSLLRGALATFNKSNQENKGE